MEEKLWDCILDPLCCVCFGFSLPSRPLIICNNKKSDLVLAIEKWGKRKQCKSDLFLRAKKYPSDLETFHRGLYL